jgi:hypothetical protein
VAIVIAYKSRKVDTTQEMYGNFVMRMHFIAGHAFTALTRLAKVYVSLPYLIDEEFPVIPIAAPL